MYNVYIASSLRNATRVKELQQRFKEAGCEIIYDWTAHGQVYTVPELTSIGKAETDAVKNCDLLFMVTPARTGSHVELGIAIALNKPIVLLFEEEVEQKAFYYVDGVRRFTDADEAFNTALSILRGE